MKQKLMVAIPLAPRFADTAGVGAVRARALEAAMRQAGDAEEVSFRSVTAVEDIPENLSVTGRADCVEAIGARLIVFVGEYMATPEAA